MTQLAPRPAPGAPRDWHFPSFERRTVAGGRVISAHLPGRPLAVTSLVFDAGAALEPRGHEGVAEIVARALSEGAAGRDAYEFGVAGERLGAGWRASTDWDSLRAGFEVPVSELPAATQLLADAVRDATFSDDALDRVLDERIDEISIERSQPAVLAAEALGASLFAPTSRYAAPDGGTQSSLDALGREDIRRYRDARLRMETATLLLVGDLSGVDVDALGATVFDGWEGAASGGTPPDVEPRTGRRTVVVDRPGSVQSVVMVGHDGPSRSVEDYVAMTTMALVLGGMFSSRLNMKIREEKGYAYGAFGGFDARKHGGIFVARASVQSEVTIPALADIVAEIERVHADGLLAEELEQARAYRAGVFPVNFAGVAPVASGLGDIASHGFPDDHFDRLRARILDVTLDEVNQAARSRLRPADFVTVIVGDAAGFVDDLPGLGLGEVEIVRDGL
ncbi:MAG TPA: pitrilysin family protein [Mycobacteriales bacterium]|nr:pitrilysin family protein [Mycobacteriales bacterium]